MRFRKTPFVFAFVLAADLAVAASAHAQSLITSSANTNVEQVGHQGYDFSLSRKMTPYFTAQVNERDQTQPIYSPLNNPGKSNYRVQGGLAYDITQNLLGKLEYQWNANVTSKLGIGEPRTKVEFKKRGFVLGLTYKTQ